MRTKQKVFTRNNVELLNISPYVEMRQTEEGIVVYQRIYGKEVFIHSKKEDIDPIINQLQKGITLDELASLVKEHLNMDEPKDFIYACMQNGVIE